MHDDVWGGLVRPRRHTHRSADERAHLRADDQRGADGIAGHLCAKPRADDCHAHSGSDGRAHTGSDRVADTSSDGRTHTGSDRVAGTGSDGLTATGSDGIDDIGAISVANRRADEGADHRPHRRDAVKCT